MPPWPQTRYFRRLRPASKCRPSRGSGRTCRLSGRTRDRRPASGAGRSRWPLGPSTGACDGQADPPNSTQWGTRRECIVRRRMANQGALRLGIVSTANINAQLLGGAAETDAVDVVAVGSRDAQKGRAFADRFGIPTVHGSYEDLLADPAVEAVYIPLPNGLHHQWTMEA